MGLFFMTAGGVPGAQSRIMSCCAIFFLFSSVIVDSTIQSVTEPFSQFLVLLCSQHCRLCSDVQFVLCRSWMTNAVANMFRRFRYVSFRPATKTLCIFNMFISIACGVLMICISVFISMHACTYIPGSFACSSTPSSPV